MMKAENDKLTDVIREVHRASHGCYGSQRVHAELREFGYAVNVKRVTRIMAAEGLQGAYKRRFCVTTDSQHPLRVAENPLDRAFRPSELDTVWASDITCIDTREGFVYLAVTMDLASRRVIGWAMDDHMRTEFVERALRMALGQRNVEAGALHHSDRGSQYASKSFSELLHANGISASMSGKGNCYDNAVIESYFGRMKVELGCDRPWASRRDAQSAIHDYIEIFYNRRRRHSTLGYLTPAAYEAGLLAASAA